MTQISPFRQSIFFSYFGGKFRIAKHYPKPKHDLIIEPFAGSAGYSVRHWDKKVLLIDTSPYVVGVWNYLIKASPEEILRLPDVPRGGSVNDLNVPQEVKWLIGFWNNHASAQPYLRPSKWSEVRPNSHWGSNVRKILARQVPFIKHWNILQGDYSNAPNIEATWFIDPPYTQQGHRYLGGVSYPKLGEWSHARKGQLIVCEAEGADWLDFQPFREIKTSEGKNGKGKGKEVIFYREVNGYA